MPQLLNYTDMQVALQAATPNPVGTVCQACNITMEKVGQDATLPAGNAGVIKFLLTANHTTPFEFVHLTFLLTDVSKAFLAQITRHRVGTFMSSSQHYQDYTDYPFVCHVDAMDAGIGEMYMQAWQNYQTLLEKGLPVHEARMVLPQGSTGTIKWDVNARSLINFLNLRCCNRNVDEMTIFANKVRKLAIAYFPELFNFVGPDCFMGNGCTQKKMSCGKPWV